MLRKANHSKRNNPVIPQRMSEIKIEDGYNNPKNDLKSFLQIILQTVYKEIAKNEPKKTNIAPIQWYIPSGPARSKLKTEIKINPIVAKIPNNNPKFLNFDENLFWWLLSEGNMYLSIRTEKSIKPPQMRIAISNI